MNVKKILVPVDFSDCSLEALDEAIELGKRFKARLLLFHAVEPIYFASAGDLYEPSFNIAALLEEQRRAAEKQLERLAGRLEKRQVRVQTLLVSGPAQHTIIEAARKHHADLIVMSTHGRSGFSHLVMGSVAEKVVRHATCPVLTVRPRKGGRNPSARSRRKRV